MREYTNRTVQSPGIPGFTTAHPYIPYHTLIHAHPSITPPWKVDRVLANQSLLLTAGTPSNIPFAWFLVLGCNRQAWVSIANSAWWWKSDTRGKQGKGMVEGREGLGVTSERV